MESESTLLNAAREMDEEALIKIFDLYSSALYKYALRLCSDPVMADHVVGDVFAKLLEQLSAGNGPDANLRSYLYQATYHRLIDETRISRRKVSLETATWLRQDAIPGSLSLEEQLLYQQILHAIGHNLTDDQRHVIILRFLEGFNLAETALIMGKKVNHVKVLQNRAITTLRAAFTPGKAKKAAPARKRRVTAQTALGIELS
jgi:RNA polymerase sigma-70 factor (ECF subfamily)